MKIRVFIVVFITAVCLTPGYGPCAETDDPFRSGISLFRSENFDKAYQHFLKAFEASPADPEVNFYLGRAAFETGNYEMAVMAFERVLIAKPSAVRVKLEMARAFQKLGVNDMARKYCREVLLTDPPESVQTNIEQFLAYIDRTEKRHFFTGAVSAGIEYNDNVFSSPSDRNVETVFGDVYLTGVTADEQEDWIYTATADLGHTYQFPYSETAWKTGGAIYRAVYDTKESLDTIYLEGSTGPRVSFGKFTAGAEFVADSLELDGSTYQKSHGIRLYGECLVSRYMIVNSEVIRTRKKFHQTPERDADHTELSLGTAFVFKDNWVDAALTYEHRNADSDVHTFDRYKGEITVRRELFPGLTGFCGYQYRHCDYDEKALLFDDAREDDIHYARAGIEKTLWQAADKRSAAVLTLSYRRTMAHSNNDLYEYSKNTVRSSLEYRF